MNSKALKQAQQAVRQAQQMERAADPSAEVEYYWGRAERLYKQAGLDPEWLDHGSLTETLDEPAPPMTAVWICPTDRVEFTYDPDPQEATGVVASVDDIYALNR